MWLPVIGIVLAVGVSLARGGRLDARADAHLRLLPILIAGLLAQTLLDALAARGRADTGVVAALLVVSLAAVLAFVVTNWFRAGMALIAAGFVLNAVVILGNGGMPVSADAIRTLGGDPAALAIAGKHQVADADTALPWLGDVIPVPGLRLIVSLGDLVLVAGMVPLAHDLMTPASAASRRQRRNLSRPVPTGRGSTR